MAEPDGYADRITRACSAIAAAGGFDRDRSATEVRGLTRAALDAAGVPELLERVAELEAELRDADGQRADALHRLAQEVTRSNAAAARIAELGAENTAVDEGRPAALDALLGHLAGALPEMTAGERADWAERDSQRSRRVAIRATRRVGEPLARIAVGEPLARIAELEAQSGQATARADAAEATVARVQAALDGVQRQVAGPGLLYPHAVAGAGEGVRQGMAWAAEAIREALEEPPTGPADTLPDHGDGATPVDPETALSRAREILAAADTSGASAATTLGLLASAIRPARPDSPEAIRARMVEMAQMADRAHVVSDRWSAGFEPPPPNAVAAGAALAHLRQRVRDGVNDWTSHAESALTPGQVDEITECVMAALTHHDCQWVADGQAIANQKLGWMVDDAGRVWEHAETETP